MNKIENGDMVAIKDMFTNGFIFMPNPEKPHLKPSWVEQLREGAIKYYEKDFNILTDNLRKK